MCSFFHHFLYITALVLLHSPLLVIATGLEKFHRDLRCYSPFHQVETPSLNACQRALHTMRQRFYGLDRNLRIGPYERDTLFSLHVPINIAWTQDGFCGVRVAIEQPLARKSWVSVDPVDLVLFSNLLISKCVASSDGPRMGGEVDLFRSVGPHRDGPPLQARIRISVSSLGRLLAADEAHNATHVEPAASNNTNATTDSSIATLESETS